MDWFLRVRKKQSMVVLKNVFLLETRRKEVPAEVPAAFNVCSEAQVSAKQTPNKIETKKTIWTCVLKQVLKNSSEFIHMDYVY